jgi:hypothetical protein
MCIVVVYNRRRIFCSVVLGCVGAFDFTLLFWDDGGWKREIPCVYDTSSGIGKTGKEEMECFNQPLETGSKNTMETFPKLRSHASK